MSTYKQALSYLLDQLPMYQRVGAAAYKADLSNITTICSLLGNPQEGLKYIHVAGTNGKGSVTHILASILQAHGWKVGVFSSPHYKDYRERIKINGKLISKKYVANFVVENKEKFSDVNASFFEITNAMAFQYFKDKKVDFIVLETGMGGRLDSTNIVTPILSVITNISLDHQQFLGNTIAKIAQEKAGIIKKNVPVVIGETQKETKPVFVAKAKQEASPIYFAQEDIILEVLKENLEGTSFLYKGKKYKTDLAGSYQITNLATALCAVEVLKKSGLHLKASKIKKGIAVVRESTRFLGRFSLIQKHPLILIDSAHNEGGIKVLVEEIAKLEVEQIHFVYGTVADKDLNPIFRLLPKSVTYYFCKPNIPRGKDALELSEEAELVGLLGDAYESVISAFKAAKLSASKKDLIVVSGSIFVVAEVI